MESFELNLVNYFVLKKQHLTDDSKINDILQITDDLCGLHATGSIEPYLALFERTQDFNKEDLEQEWYVKKNLGRIRCMRKTLFIQTKNVIPIVYAATNNMLENLLEKYLKARGISSKDYSDLSHEIIESLKDKERSTSEIKKTLSSPLDISAVISVMCDRGLLARSKPVKGWKDRRINYTLFCNYFPDINLRKYSEEEAISVLVRNYIKSYGPVTESDIAWWTGLGKSEIKNALKTLENIITKVKISHLEGDYIIYKPDINNIKLVSSTLETNVNILPTLDPYLMGYKDRERYLDVDNYDNIFDRSGNATSSVLLDGKIIGVWNVVEKPKAGVKFFLFKSIEEKIKNTIVLKLKKIGEFITEKSVEIRECDSMTPLNKRPAGGFMTPLKDS